MKPIKPPCKNDCTEPPAFPREPVNRPGLTRIDYRVGVWAGIREAIFRDLNGQGPLEAWTQRGNDDPDAVIHDPAVALIEGAAMIGDILSFYQELYANEAYLNTATWRESIADLVRLTGYRLSPGVGGKALFTLEFRGSRPVAVPAGFPIKAQVTGLEQPAEFETSRTIEAHPHLGAFHLYRPRLPKGPIHDGAATRSRLEIEAVDGKGDMTGVAGHGVKPGDRIMLSPDASMFDQSAPWSDAHPQKRAEILVVTGVETVLDRTILTFEGALTEIRPETTITACRLGRTFSHFGHNAPAWTTRYDALESLGKVSREKTEFKRKMRVNHAPESADADYYSTLEKRDAPLDAEVNDLAQGARLICQGVFDEEGGSGPADFTLIKTIVGVRGDALTWGNLAGPCTVASVDSDWIRNNQAPFTTADIRRMKFHEVKGPLLTLRAPAAWASGAFTDHRLAYFGTWREAGALADRRLLLARPDGAAARATASAGPDGFSLAGKDRRNPWMWEVALDRLPAEFTLEDFDETEPRVRVHGNLVEAFQGKIEKEAVLGNGDNRVRRQTFKLPKAPLTYLNSAAGETPPETPKLKVYVEGRLWKRVPTFFGRGPKEEVYIVREDLRNDSWIQFGDGKTGARLPSGIKNVVAVYRTGIGAHGALKEETSVQPAGKLDRLSKIHMPSPAAGGSRPETGENAREAAPGKLRSLGRLVSLGDFESEALAIAGVSKARARWGLVGAGPAVILSVLMETGRVDEIENVRGLLNAYNTCRGPRRFPVIVKQARRAWLYIDARFGLNAAFKEADVMAAVKRALGVSGEETDGVDGARGLFGLRGRRLGRNGYATRIEAAAQNVAGVDWVKVDALGSLGECDAPSGRALPGPPRPLRTAVVCDDDHILALHGKHLNLTAVASETGKEC